MRAPGAEPVRSQDMGRGPYENEERAGDNFRLAKQLSFDISSEFRSCTPRQEGLIEDCRIGDAELVQFCEPGTELVDEPHVQGKDASKGPDASGASEEDEDDESGDEVSEGDEDDDDEDEVDEEPSRFSQSKP